MNYWEEFEKLKKEYFNLSFENLKISNKCKSNEEEITILNKENDEYKIIIDEFKCEQKKMSKELNNIKKEYNKMLLQRIELENKCIDFDEKAKKNIEKKNKVIEGLRIKNKDLEKALNNALLEKNDLSNEFEILKKNQYNLIKLNEKNINKYQMRLETMESLNQLKSENLERLEKFQEQRDREIKELINQNNEIKEQYEEFKNKKEELDGISLYDELKSNKIVVDFQLLNEKSISRVNFQEANDKLKGEIIIGLKSIEMSITQIINNLNKNIN